MSVVHIEVVLHSDWSTVLEGWLSNSHR